MTDEIEIESEAEIQVDPVCGAVVEIEDATAHSLAIEYEGRDYVFCGAACRARFERAPIRYAVSGRAQP